MQVGWSRFNGLSITRGARGVALYELVLGFRQDENDTVGIRPIDELEMIDISRHGCVFGPSVKPAESGAHCDTMQLEGTGSGPFGPLLSVDCVDYGSSNAAELLHTQVTLADYQHCLILGGQLPWQVYPLRPGDYQGDPNAFAGGCQDVRLTDCVVAGAVGKMGFTQVQNSTLSYTPVDKQQPSVSGAWTRRREHRRLGPGDHHVAAGDPRLRDPDAARALDLVGTTAVRRAFSESTSSRRGRCRTSAPHLRASSGRSPRARSPRPSRPPRRSRAPSAR